MYSLSKKDTVWSNKEFEKVFDDMFDGFFVKNISTFKSPAYGIGCKWETDTQLWVLAPGLQKDDLDVDIHNSKMTIKWSNKYSSGNYVVPIPDKTIEVEIDVVDGVITADFITQASDISLKIK
jgi:HSP20 family molecular chaperone IbpA